MSNAFKSIGKVFKKVVKVVKKVALPALVIGAIVLTGGAALGVLPALGAGGLGLSAGLASVVSSAGIGGLVGGATAAISGKNILKGITKGGVIGAATGGIGHLAKGALAGAQLAGAAGSTAGSTAGSLAGTAGAGAADAITVVGNAARGGSALISGASGIGALAGGIGGDLLAPPSSQQQPPSMGLDSIAVRPGVDIADSAVAAARGSAGGLGGTLSGIAQNPLVAAGVLQGIGGAFTAGAEAKSLRKAEREKQERIRANYATAGTSFPTAPANYTIEPERRLIWKIHPISGELYQDAA